MIMTYVLTAATLGGLSMVSLLLYMRLARGVFSGPSDNIVTWRYGFADCVFAAALTAFFIFMVAAKLFMEPSYGQVVDMEVLIASCVLFGTFIIGINSFLLVRGINPLEVFGLAKQNWSRLFLISFGWLLAAYPLILVAQIISHEHLARDSGPQEIVSFLINNPTFGDQLTVVLLAVVVAPIAEELIFRGYLYGVLRKYTGRLSAILLSSLLFAAIHLHAPSFAGLFILAVVLALVYERTGSLWAPIAMHAVFNAVSVFLAINWPDLVA